MKKILLLVGILVLIVTFVAGGDDIEAQTETSEAIISFESGIVVNKDNSIDVTEQIVYATGKEEHHGIYRDIYPYSAQGAKMSIGHVSVTDESGGKYQYETLSEGKNIRLKIGDPEKTFSGQKTYVIKYHATRAVSQLDALDEIYWNVTGNDWSMPINQVRVSVTLPEGATATQSACFYGTNGAKDQCGSGIAVGQTYSFIAPRALEAKEGVTIAVGFPKGIVEPYGSTDKAAGFLFEYGLWFLALLFPLVSFILSYRHWRKYGRDDRPTGAIITQFDAPGELTPMQAGGVIAERVNMNHLSAEIIYLATKGYLKISETEKKFLGVKSKDYELTKLKNSSDLPEHELELMKGLFAEGVTTVKVSELKTTFPMVVTGIMALAYDGLLKFGYYKDRNRIKFKESYGYILLFLAAWIAVFVFAISRVDKNPIDLIVLIISIILSVAISIIFYGFSPAKTVKGVEAKEYLLGLKNYLQIAEKDRLEFHNAPEKKPEIFEKLLPYAMTFGVADIWAKEFKDIYLTPPAWYSSSNSAGFNAVIFTNSLSGFTTASTMASTSSGSSGGGSSGGGGGGGGGGSW